MKVPEVLRDPRDNESWLGYLGRRTADVVCLWLLYHFLKWLGVIVVITVQTP